MKKPLPPMTLYTYTLLTKTKSELNRLSLKMKLRKSARKISQLSSGIAKRVVLRWTSWRKPIRSFAKNG